MAAPLTYADWVPQLELFGQGNDTILDDLQKGTFTLDAGTALRFYSRVEQCYKARKKLWLEKFQRLTQQQSLRSINDFEMVLFQGKAMLQPLVKFCSLPAFPADLQKTLRDDLNAFVTDIRDSLKSNVSKLSNDREKIVLFIHSFSIYPSSIPAPPNSSGISPSPAPGRKIIF